MVHRAPPSPVIDSATMFAATLLLVWMLVSAMVWLILAGSEWLKAWLMTAA